MKADKSVKMKENRNPVLGDFVATQAPVHISIVSVRKCFLLASLFFFVQSEIEFILYH